MSHSHCLLYITHLIQKSIFLPVQTVPPYVTFHALFDGVVEKNKKTVEHGQVLKIRVNSIRNPL